MKVAVAVLGSPVPNDPYGLCGRIATFEEQSSGAVCESRGGRPGQSLIRLMVFVDVKQHLKNRAQDLRESRGGRPGLSLIHISEPTRPP